MTLKAHVEIDKFIRSNYPILGSIYFYRSYIIFIALFLFISLFVTSPSYSEVNNNSISNQKLLPLEKQKQQLIQILKRKVILEKEIEKLKKLPPSKEIEERNEEIQESLKAINRNLETISTQVQEEKIYQGQKPELSWMDELKEITRPILVALRDITEKPRKVDTLKAKIQSLKNQIANYERARENLEKLMVLKLDALILTEEDKDSGLKISDIEKSFKDKLEGFKKKYDPELLRFELEEAEKNLLSLQTSQKSIFEIGTSFITEFLQIRGRNLFIAFATFCVFWGSLAGFFWFVKTKTLLMEKLSSQYQKFISAAYNVFSILTASLASLFALYFLDDWLILSILILIFIGIGLGFRNVLPKFLKELRLILNLGTIREGERLIWNGVPWLVQEIGVIVILRNPSLQGGMLRLMVGDLIGHHSRPLVHDEEWFPTRSDDWVILSDETYGRVVKQTSEQVVLENLASKKYYLTHEFLRMNPRNLSTGYRIVIKFGLDYGVQAKICDEIPKLFEERLKNHFQEKIEKDPPDILSLHVHFDSAGASSLNLIILVKVNGNCADDFYPLKWEINKILVQICNENQFIIPFTQLTVSPSNDLKALVKSR